MADLSADWQLELDVPDDRIGYVLAAQNETEARFAGPLSAQLRGAQPSTMGRIAEVCQTANVSDDKTAGRSQRS